MSKLADISTINDDFLKVVRYKGLAKSVRENVVKFAVKNEGKKYDICAVFTLLWVLLTKKRGAPRVIGNQYKFICSELVAYGFDANGLPIMPPYSYDDIIPEDFNSSKYFETVYVAEKLS